MVARGRRRGEGVVEGVRVVTSAGRWCGIATNAMRGLGWVVEGVVVGGGGRDGIRGRIRRC